MWILWKLRFSKSEFSEKLHSENVNFVIFFGKKRIFFTLLLIYSSLHSKRNLPVLSGCTHESDDLVVRGVDDGDVVNGDDFVAAEKSSIEIGCSTGNNVSNRNLKKLWILLQLAEFHEFYNIEFLKMWILRKIQILKKWILWKIGKLRFSKSELCKKWDFENVNFVKIQNLKAWILSKLRIWKSEFCENSYFEKVNFVKIDILKEWFLWNIRLRKGKFCENRYFENVSFAKIEILKAWILWKLRFWIRDFCANSIFENVNFVKIEDLKTWI